MKFDLILRVGTKLVLPFILLFAVYVQLHGDFGPGGGFQAGVIVAAVVILIAITFGNSAAKRVAPRRLVEYMVPLGVLIFAGTGVVSLLMGGNYLEYGVLARDPVNGHHLGIIVIELGVMVSVSGTMVALFYAFIERGR